jgi:hypothetical protein
MAPYEDELSTNESVGFLTRLHQVSTVFSRLRSQREHNASRFASRMARVSSAAETVLQPRDAWPVTH